MATARRATGYDDNGEDDVGVVALIRIVVKYIIPLILLRKLSE